MCARPGTYRTSGQIHLTDAVHLAGGLSPDAQTADAQVFRYLPDGKFKIFSVSLSQALGGDPSENIMSAAARSPVDPPESRRSGASHGLCPGRSRKAGPLSA